MSSKIPGVPDLFAMPDFTKLFGEMKFPALPDMESLMAASKRNMEALSAANRVALEGAQAVARRHMEIMQQNMSELTEAMKALSTSTAPQEKIQKQTELFRAAYERAAQNMQEMSGLIQKSNTEAIGVLNARFNEAVAEVKAIADKATKG